MSSNSRFKSFTSAVSNAFRQRDSSRVCMPSFKSVVSSPPVPITNPPPERQTEPKSYWAQPEAVPVEEIPVITDQFKRIEIRKLLQDYCQPTGSREYGLPDWHDVDRYCTENAFDKLLALLPPGIPLRMALYTEGRGVRFKMDDQSYDVFSVPRELFSIWGLTTTIMKLIYPLNRKAMEIKDCRVAMFQEVMHLLIGWSRLSFWKPRPAISRQRLVRESPVHTYCIRATLPGCCTHNWLVNAESPEHAAAILDQSNNWLETLTTLTAAAKLLDTTTPGRIFLPD